MTLFVVSVFRTLGNFIRLVTFFKLFVSMFWSFWNFMRLLTLFVLSVFRSLGNFIRLFTLFVVSVFQSLGNFIRLFTLFVVSVFRSLGNFIRLVTLFIISLFRSLGNFMRLVTLFVISLNCSQFMWESLGMAIFSCFPLQVHWKFHEYGGKGLQLDQWAPPFCSHWLTMSPPLILPEWFGNGIEVHFQCGNHYELVQIVHHCHSFVSCCIQN